MPHVRGLDCTGAFPNQQWMSTCLHLPSPNCKEEFRDRQIACRRHAYEYGFDSPEICGWTALRQASSEGLVALAGRSQQPSLRQVYSSSCSNKRAGHLLVCTLPVACRPAHPPAHIPALPVLGRGCLLARIAKTLSFLWLNASLAVGIAPAYSIDVRVERC